MRKVIRVSAFGLLLAATCGQIMAQEAPPPGPETEIMESFDVAVALSPAVPMPPGDFGDGPPEAGPPPMLDGGVDMMAHGFGGGGGPMGSLRPDQMSDEQLEKIHKAKEDFLDKAGPKMVELGSQHRALRDAMMQPELDKAKIQSIQSKINGLMGDLANLKLEKDLANAQALTSEQRKEIRRAYLKRSEFGGCGGGMRMMRHHFRGRGGGGGGPCPMGGGSCPKDGGGPGGGPAK